MKRRDCLAILGTAALAGCAGVPRASGTGDLGVVIERARGTVAIVNTSTRTLLAEVPGLGDLSHASVVFARDGASAFVFGRDGALTRVNLLTQRIDARVMQAGNSIGGAISQDGTLVAAQNYTPGGVKVFDARTLELVADIPAYYRASHEPERRAAPSSGEAPLGGAAAAGDGGLRRSRVVGLVDLPGRRFAYALFDADAIWIADLSQPGAPRVTRFDNIGRQPYDALVTPDGRHYIAGLFGEDGLALVDLWQREPTARRILAGYGRGEQPLPVYKMPHLRGWAVAGRHAYLPAIGRHEVLVVDTLTLAGGRPHRGGRPAGVRDRAARRPPGVGQLRAARLPPRAGDRHARAARGAHARAGQGGAAHGVHAARRGGVDQLRATTTAWSCSTRRTSQALATLSVDSPSGIFFTARAARMGF